MASTARSLHGGRIMIEKLVLAVLLGLACPFALLVVPEMEEEDE